MAKNKSKEQFDQTTDRDTRMQLAMAAIEKQFGKGSIITNSSEYPEIERIPTGSPALDKITNGGYGKGRIVEIYGPESSGKTTLTLCAIAECQKQGGKCAFIDAEHALDPHYARLLGVDIDNLIISQPDCGEDALNITDTLVRSGAVDLVVLDSVAALTPRAELDGQTGDHRVGLHARMMSQSLRILTGSAQQSSTTIIFINQIRMKIGVMFGSPETTTGGEALKFFSSQRFEIRRKEVLKNGDEPIGITSRIKVAKNKIGPPYRQVEVDIIFGQGIDWAKDLLNMAVEYDIINKSGAWYSYKDEKIGQGTVNACEAIRDNPELAADIKAQVLL